MYANVVGLDIAKNIFHLFYSSVTRFRVVTLGKTLQRQRLQEINSN